MKDDFYNRKEHIIKSTTPIIKKERSTPTSSKYRSKVQIMYDIMLPLSKYERVSSLVHRVEYSGMTKTQIMYKSLLSYQQLKEYLSGLLADELIIQDETTNRFNLTQKGYKFVKLFDELAELCPDIKSVYY
jgi:predicted transcriptional regulator